MFLFCYVCSSREVICLAVELKSWCLDLVFITPRSSTQRLSHTQTQPQNTAVRVILPQINASMCCPVDVVISDDSLWGNIKTSDGRSKRRRDSHKTRNTSSLVSHLRLVASSIMLCSFLSVARRIRCCHAYPGGRSWYSLPYQPRTDAFISNPIQCKTSSISPSSTSTARSYTSKNKPDEFEDLSSYDATFNLSGYQRPKVNWYPGHIAK